MLHTLTFSKSQYHMALFPNGRCRPSESQWMLLASYDIPNDCRLERWVDRVQKPVDSSSPQSPVQQIIKKYTACARLDEGAVQRLFGCGDMN